MPTISSMTLPKPANWQDFERMTRDALALKWASPDLQMNGRSGQNQNGVDVWGADAIGRRVGVQCKRCVEAPSLALVIGEADKATAFGQLSALFVATTAPHDAKLQQQVRNLSDTRVAQGEPAIAMLFWDDIVDGLKMNSDVLRSHYPQITLEHSGALDTERALALLELGYFGTELWEYVVLTFGEFGWMAQADPDELFATLDILEKRARLVLAPDDAEPIVEALSTVRECCKSTKTCKSDWDPVEVCAKRVGTRLGRVQGALPLAEQNILDLAMHLARIYHHLEDGPDEVILEKLGRKLRKVLPEASEPRIATSLAAVSESRSGYALAQKLYSLLDQELRWA